jgi:hypothetical protein
MYLPLEIALWEKMLATRENFLARITIYKTLIFQGEEHGCGRDSEVRSTLLDVY